MGTVLVVSGEPPTGGARHRHSAPRVAAVSLAERATLVTALAPSHAELAAGSTLCAA